MAQHGMLAGEVCDFPGDSDQVPRFYFNYCLADFN